MRRGSHGPNPGHEIPDSLAGIFAGTAMAVSAHLTPTYPLALGGYTFPGYTAFCTIILNLAVAMVLTPVLNAMSAGRTPRDETAAADYRA